jgi:phosphatidylglycerophosphate synthase
MRKLDACNENPVDDVLLHLIEPLCPAFKKLGATPNDITTISLFFGLLSVYMLYLGHVYLSMGLYALSYFFDCMDGHYARKYGMVTKLGDSYDHIKDGIVMAGVIGVFIYRNRGCSLSRFIPIMMVLGITLLAMLSHMGCQEKIYDKDESGTLEVWKNLCPGNPSKNIQFTKYFGCGTAIIITIIAIIYVEKNMSCATR